MRLLLDTHVYLWWLANALDRVGPARRSIQDAEVVYISVASLWELSIKVALGKLDSDLDAAFDVTRQGFLLLQIDAPEARQVSLLPHLHGDPFDRMLVAQAKMHNLVLVSHDPKVLAYDVASLAV